MSKYLKNIDNSLHLVECGRDGCNIFKIYTEKQKVPIEEVMNWKKEKKSVYFDFYRIYST
ncbi:MAG: hypothetical protein AABW88_01590 [Nanoarchaeota archaeon]